MRIPIPCFWIALFLISCSDPVVGTNSKHESKFVQMKIKYQSPLPDYPAAAKIAHIDGKVVVEVSVGVDGVPTSAHALEGPKELHQVSEEYLLGWRFEPATLNGVAQSMRFKITTVWHLKK